ncbi:MAG: hypothetical protein KAT77_01400 [Nanoarchaeota archaeon]|nr:hypothetical protein [Nanoarchaeota archaeon]
MRIKNELDLMGHRTEDYHDNQEYDSEDWYENRNFCSNRTLFSQLKEKPLEKRLGEPVASYQEVYRQETDYLTQDLLKKAGTRERDEFDSVKRFPVNYKDNGTSALTVEITKGKETLLYTYLMDSREALLFELGWELGRTNVFDYSGGKVSPKLESPKIDEIEKVFGPPVDRERFQWVVDAFHDQHLFHWDIEKIYRKDIGNRNAFAVYSNPDGRDKSILFTLTPTEEFLIQNEDKIDLSHIQYINKQGLCRAPQYDWHTALKNPSQEKRKEIRQKLKKVAHLGEKDWCLGDIKFKDIGKETVVWVDYKDLDTSGIFTILS